MQCNVMNGMVWYGMVWYGMVWYGMVWYVCMYVRVDLSMHFELLPLPGFNMF